MAEIFVRDPENLQNLQREEFLLPFRMYLFTSQALVCHTDYDVFNNVLKGNAHAIFKRVSSSSN